jgi:magnesium-transporting ATPase (P-type)
LRNILLAYRDISGNVNLEDPLLLGENLIFIGITGIKDPLRSGVP